MINRVKYDFFQKLKKVFHYSGFIVERIPDANRLFDDLTNVHLEIKKHELKRIAKSIRLAENHSLYNRILKRYVPDWEDKPTYAEFVGAGRGYSNIDVYRKISYNNDDNVYFEKIYFNDSYDLFKMEWFYKHVYPILKHEIKTSKLYKITKGELITIVNFEYIDLVRLEKHDWQTFFGLSKRLLKLRTHTESLCKRAPKLLKNYNLHDEYSKTTKVAKKIISELSTKGLTSRKIKKMINTGPLIFSHGDIYDTNVFSGDFFIDWDAFGFYPLGFEIAMILSFTHMTPTFKELYEVIEKEYKEVIDQDLWDGFTLSCLYFYFVVTSIKPQNTPHLQLQKDIISHIEMLYWKKMDRNYRA